MKMECKRQPLSLAAAFCLLLLSLYNSNVADAFSSPASRRTCAEVSCVARKFSSLRHKRAEMQPTVRALRLMQYPRKSAVTSQRTKRMKPQLYAAATDNVSSNSNGDGGSKSEYNWTKQTLQITGPALIGMLVDPMLSLMDTAYVGRLGTKELAALGACTSIFHLSFNAFRATTTATTSLVASALQRDPKQAQEVTSISLKLVVCMGLCVMAGLRLGSTWCLGTMGIPIHSALYTPAKQYLTTRLWAAPVVLGILVSEGTFRGYGNTKIPLCASLVAATINLILDPILMFPLGLGVKGAAAATAISQVGSFSVYAYFLKKRNMLGGRPEVDTTAIPTSDAISAPVTSVSDESIQALEVDESSELDEPPVGGHVRRIQVVRAILSANLAMITKQGSLLLAWAYATSRATRIGASTVAAHQVALSCWLVLALMLDGAAVSAQVLMSRTLAQKGTKQRSDKVRSLISYFGRVASLQGAAAGLLWFTCLGRFVAPYVFTSDMAIRGHLIALMPTLTLQLILVSLTLVVEGLAVGGHQFQIMGLGTTISTILAMSQLRQATDLVTIWGRGINTLFAGRLLTSAIATFKVTRMVTANKESDDDSDCS